jgi:hypothetical protein
MRSDEMLEVEKAYSVPNRRCQDQGRDCLEAAERERSERGQDDKERAGERSDITQKKVGREVASRST